MLVRSLSARPSQQQFLINLLCNTTISDEKHDLDTQLNSVTEALKQVPYDYIIELMELRSSCAMEKLTAVKYEFDFQNHTNKKQMKKDEAEEKKKSLAVFWNQLNARFLEMKNVIKTIKEYGNNTKEEQMSALEQLEESGLFLNSAEDRSKIKKLPAANVEVAKDDFAKQIINWKKSEIAFSDQIGTVTFQDDNAKKYWKKAGNSEKILSEDLSLMLTNSFILVKNLNMKLGAIKRELPLLKETLSKQKGLSGKDETERDHLLARIKKAIKQKSIDETIKELERALEKESGLQFRVILFKVVKDIFLWSDVLDFQNKVAEDFWNHVRSRNSTIVGPSIAKATQCLRPRSATATYKSPAPNDNDQETVSSPRPR